MKNPSSQLGMLLNWRLHLIVIVVSVVAELIGIQRLPIGNVSLLFLPLFYAFALCLFCQPERDKIFR